ncbi:MAG: hypothetical protein U1G08_02460 [Verrucomicrobiota bacterium]
MKTILSLGCYRFVLSSASVAKAIAEALREAPQVEKVGLTTVLSPIYESAPEARRMGYFFVHQVKDEQVVAPEPKPSSPTVKAILDLPPKAARETRRTLAAGTPKRSRHDLAIR